MLCCLLADVFPVQMEDQPEGFGGPFGDASANEKGFKRYQASSKTSRVGLVWCCVV